MRHFDGENAVNTGEAREIASIGTVRERRE